MRGAVWIRRASGARAGRARRRRRERAPISTPLIVTHDGAARPPGHRRAPSTLTPAARRVRMGRPADLIGEALPRTVSLAVLSLVAAVAIVPPAGIISAVRRCSTADHVVTVFALLGSR